ncbi:MAG: ABC transporter substrate-binding protein [Thermaerobacter sp.]|nr:ABC transporter substrate-binding protein [Thermaerobacter sp.]
MKANWQRVLTLAVAVLVLGAAGCGSQTTAPQSKGPVEGGTLSIEVSADPVGLDPANTLDNDSGYVLGTLYDGLTAYGVGNTTVKPGLAKSWQITNGGKTYIFDLRQGVKFSDGAPFNAQAVAFWVDHLINPKNPDYYANLKGAETFVPFTWGNVTGTQILGPYKIAINMSQPNGEFLADLAMVWNGVTSPKMLKTYGTDAWQHPAGTGPFEFVRWVKGQYVEVKANPDYWGGKPHLSEILFKIIPDQSAQLLSLKTGAINILTDVAPSEIPTIKGDKSLRLLAEPGLDDNYVSLPVQTGPFKSLLVRQAVNYAVDKQAIDQSLYGGYAQVMNSPLPTVAFGYDPNIPAYSYNLQKAKQLMQQAGYGKGFTFTIDVYNNARGYNPIGGPELAVAIQNDLAKIGITLKLNVLDPATWLAEARSTSFNKMSLAGWTGDNGDPDDMISPLFNGNAFTTGNFSHYNNATVNQDFAKALLTSNPTQRAAIYDQVQKTIMKDAPAIFLNYTNLMRAESTSVHGFVPNPTFFYVNMNQVWLSK